MRSHGVGDALNSRDTLAAVESEAIRVNRRGGAECRRTVQDINDASERQLQQEVRQLAVTQRAGQLTREQLSRLSDIALGGSYEALQTLEMEASDAGTLRDEAAALLSANQELAPIHKLIVWTKSATPEFRLQALRALGKMESPLARQALSRVACEKDGGLAQVALGLIETLEPERAITHLEHISRAAAIAEIRAAANLARERLLDAMTHAK